MIIPSLLILSIAGPTFPPSELALLPPSGLSQKSLPLEPRESPGVEIPASGSYVSKYGPTYGNSTAGALTRSQCKGFLGKTTRTYEYAKPVIHSLVDSSLYFGAGALLGSASLLSGIGWSLCQLTPWSEQIGNECLIAFQTLGIASVHSFSQGLRISPFFSFFFEKVPSTYSSWERNKALLSQIPASSPEDKQLLNFLQNRWFARITGCYPFLVDWMCPPFGISLQMHPETTNSYARDPSNKFSATYKNRIEAWKQFLPHPKEFPLILTRPSNIRDYLPACFEMTQGEEIQQFIDNDKSPLLVDLTSVLPGETLNRRQWLEAWNAFEEQLSTWCREHKLDPDRILWIQRVAQKDIGGIRLLPFPSSSQEKTEQHYQFLLEWISRFGLSANRIELDRSYLPQAVSLPQQTGALSPALEYASQEHWAELFTVIEQSWKSAHPQKTLMVKGTLQVLKDLCASVTEDKWQLAMNSPTRAAAVQLSFSKIEHQLQLALQKQEKSSFQEIASHIEQIHADLSPLLEIFSPFAFEDFTAAIRRHLTCIPETMEGLTDFALHSSAMTSLGGIFKTVEKFTGRHPRILFGENTYFECIHASEKMLKATSIKEASEEDWKEADLLLVQFNPTVKRINFEVTEYQATEYHVEKIADIIRRALNAREGTPLSVALDCTLDFSNSPRVGSLLAEFQNEIEQGQLNLLCYRSGLKFDLFGMDNYCCAPFFMVHNNDPKWASFEPLLSDPALQTDSLSLNWFTLAYQNASPYLEMYRKQIFDNTRAILDKIPPRLFSSKNLFYRVIPIDRDADPSFLDIKIFGPLHTFRGELLVGVSTMIRCLEAGFPLLFRPGIGFHHPNLAVLFGTDCTTVRLTIGLDPAQVDVIVRCLEQIDTCNMAL